MIIWHKHKINHKNINCKIKVTWLCKYTVVWICRSLGMEVDVIGHMALQCAATRNLAVDCCLHIQCH